MMDVSAVVPTYEREDKLKRALESISDQTYTDIELIVVDDNPSQEYRDKVENAVQEISEETDFPVRRILNDDGQGVSSARNLGIRKAEGRYIAFLDDDDEWKPEKIEKQAEKIKEEEGVKAVYTASEMYDEGEVKDIVRKTPGLDLDSLLERDRIGSPSKVMIEKEWLEKIGGFDEDIPSAEDWDLWIRLMKQGCNFAYIDEPLTRYHQSDDSKSSQFEIATEGREKITEKHSRLLEEASSKVRARHHINRAKKQYTLRDNKGTRKHLSKTLRNNPLEPEAYALTIIYLTKKLTGLDLIPLAAKIKGKIK
jgi:glycosyltransferase involved in cell wall biosynthesis